MTCYFEVSSQGGSDLVEGGLNYISDIYNSSDAAHTGIAPYYRSTYGPQYNNLNSNGYHYSCGQQLVVAHGLVNGLSQTYTFTAQVGSGFDPSSFWAGQKYTFPHPSWGFYDRPSSMNHAGTDAVGVATPCTTCSFSKVTGIGQRGDSDDGSYFGVDANGDSTIHWTQVGYGEWESGCNPNASYCLLQYSSNFAKYYGGEEYYYGLSRDPDVVLIEGPESTGYGPWESYDSVALPDAAFGESFRRSPARRAAGAFTAPAPSCTPDAYGYCVYSSNSGAYYSGCYDQNGTSWSIPYGTNSYVVQTPPNNVLVSFNDNYNDDTSCGYYESWTPYDLRSYDPDLYLPAL